jgi:hypothetical protein
MRGFLGSIFGAAHIHRQPAPIPADEEAIVNWILGGPHPSIRRQQVAPPPSSEDDVYSAIRRRWGAHALRQPGPDPTLLGCTAGVITRAWRR